MSLGVVAVLVILLLIAAYAVTLYNGLVRLKHGVGKAWANIDVLLRQRHEELPKLVETCRQYMQHERSTLEQVISARNAVSSGLESGIADRRELYNEAVNLNNVRIEQFPDVILARLFGFKEAALLQFSEAEKADVNLKALLG